MEADNLRTASLYINNQLLSRGLLRNGENIDFARPSNGEGGLDATMARVMSVINDLILRRDRDATQRETLSTTLRTLKADSLRQTTDLERLQMKNSESARKLGIAEAADRAQKSQLRAAEHAARGLKEEMVRMKVLVGQTRAQCAVEVRKRERVIEGLKRHVGEGGRARGSGKAVGVVNIAVVAGVGGEGEDRGGLVKGVGEEGYDLRSETNEFLTELARGLSEENEHLAALVRRTVSTLRSLSGCENDASRTVVLTENSYESLSSDMDSVIEHLRTLLTNPSFVPLEEVEVREEEIIRLREGWERMESRWREAMGMMDGWRKRMARSGQTVNLEELKMGLMLSPLKAAEGEKNLQLSTLMEEGEGDTLADIDAMDSSNLEVVEPDFEDESDASSLFEEEPDEEDQDEAGEVSEEVEEQQKDFSLESVMLEPPQLSPLRETDGNRQNKGFTTIVEENTYDLLQLDSSTSKNTPTLKPKPSSSKKESVRPAQSKAQLEPEESADELSLLKTSYPPSKQIYSSPKKTLAPKVTQTQAQTPRLKSEASSKLPRPRETLPQQSPLTMATIAAKLAATEREADAARVRAKLKAARMKSMPPSTTAPVPKKTTSAKAGIDGAIDEPADSDESGVASRKRKAARQGGRASRRRSTLSPWELESLILGAVGEA